MNMSISTPAILDMTMAMIDRVADARNICSIIGKRLLYYAAST